MILKLVFLFFLVVVSVGKSVMAADYTTVNHVLGRAPVATAGTTTDDHNDNGLIDIGDRVWCVATTTYDADGDRVRLEGFEFRFTDTDALIVSRDYFDIGYDHAGRQVYCKLRPYTDPATSDPSRGEYVSSVNISIRPLIKLSTITVSGYVDGVVKVNQPLTATVSSTGGPCPTTLRYQWSLETSADSGTYATISGATSTTYTPINTQQRRRLRVSVRD